MLYLRQNNIKKVSCFYKNVWFYRFFFCHFVRIKCRKELHCSKLFSLRMQNIPLTVRKMCETTAHPRAMRKKFCTLDTAVTISLTCVKFCASLLNALHIALLNYQRRTELAFSSASIANASLHGFTSFCDLVSKYFARKIA